MVFLGGRNGLVQNWASSYSSQQRGMARISMYRADCGIVGLSDQRVFRIEALVANRADHPSDCLGQFQLG